MNGVWSVTGATWTGVEGLRRGRCGLYSVLALVLVVENEGSTGLGKGPGMTAMRREEGDDGDGAVGKVDVLVFDPPGGTHWSGVRRALCALGDAHGGL